MWEEKRGNKYKFIERYIDPSTGLEKKVSIVLKDNSLKSKQYALSALNQEISRRVMLLEAEETINTCTFEELCSVYITEIQYSVKKATLTRNRYACNALLKILDPNIPVNDLNASYVRQQFFKSKKTAVSLNEYRRRFFAIMRWGYKNDLVNDIQWLKKIERFPDRNHLYKESINDKYLEPKELEILINEMQTDYWKDLTLFLVLSGLRIGEALALFVKDVDLVKRIIYVHGTYNSNLNTVTTPKTITSYREVIIQNELYNVCQQIFQRREESQKTKGEKTDYFFLNYKTGRHLTATAYRYTLSQVKGINKHLFPHMLRHTHASLLAAEGVSLDAISRRLGHASDGKMTRDVYLHITEKQKQKDKNALKNIKVL